MDISKVLFDYLISDNVKTSFEDLDVNADGVINQSDVLATDNSDIANQIQAILNIVDNDPEIDNNLPIAQVTAEYSKLLANNTQSRLGEISEEISEKEEEYKNLQAKLEQKQEEYEEISKKIEETSTEDEAVSLQNLAANLSSEITSLSADIENLASEISALNTEYENKSKQLQLENSVSDSVSQKAGSIDITNLINFDNNTDNDDTTNKTGDNDNNDDDNTDTDTTNKTTTTTETDTDTTNTNEYYSEDKGVNIANVAKLIGDIYAKIDTDDDIQAAYKEYALDSSPDTVRDAAWESTKNWANYAKSDNHKIMFAAHYILTNGTEEQKSALRALCPDAEDDLGVRRYIRIISRGKNYGKDGGLKFYKSGEDIEENIIKSLTSGDTNENGYITEAEASASISDKVKSRVINGDPIRKGKGNFR